MSISEHRTSLPPVCAEVDRILTEVDSHVDWLYYLSPLDNDAIWSTFQASGYNAEPVLRYVDLPDNYRGVRRRLQNLPLDDIEVPAIRALLAEKQQELSLQCELVMLRDTEGFSSVSIDLFGGTDTSLLLLAKDILNSVGEETLPPDTLDCNQVLQAANEHLAYYRQQAPDLESTASIKDDLNSLMMVRRGNFEVARSVQIPQDRVAALMAHEIGVHVVTKYNGRQQLLKQFECGLAHYDGLQEGLGTLSEYLAGYLPAARLRVIAARVVATDLALKRNGIAEIFAELHESYGINPEDAFDIAVRARRGGGLTKDCVYLYGLRELLAYLADGGDFEFLHLGKFALRQRFTVAELIEEGWVQPARLLPRHLSSESGRARLEHVRSIGVEHLFQGRPEI